jgi:hypothetical protein
MQNLSIHTSSINTHARALAVCLLILLFATPGAAQIRPAAQNPPRPSQAENENNSASEMESESESESETRETRIRPRTTDPATILRKAHFIRVHSDSIFVSEEEVEDSLLKRKEFRAWGMVVTRNDSEADLFIEITRKSFTRRFTFTVIDPHTMEVVASGKMRSVIFGKKISNKVAEQFANRVKIVRPYPPVASLNP